MGVNAVVLFSKSQTSFLFGHAGAGSQCLCVLRGSSQCLPY